MALTDLAADPRVQRTQFVVIDFESLTRPGVPPNPSKSPPSSSPCGRPVSGKRPGDSSR